MHDILRDRKCNTSEDCPRVSLVGERAKRARHSQVCTIENRRYNILEKWFPLQGERVQSLNLYNVRMLVFKNNIEMRKRR